MNVKYLKYWKINTWYVSCNYITRMKFYKSLNPPFLFFLVEWETILLKNLDTRFFLFFFFKKRGKGNNCTEIFALRNARTFLPRPNKSRFKKNGKRTGFYYRVWESSRMPGAIEFWLSSTRTARARFYPRWCIPHKAAAVWLLNKLHVTGRDWPR